MTKKDFELIAGAFSIAESRIEEGNISEETKKYGRTVLFCAVRCMGDEIERFHPRFNRARFEAWALPIRSADLKERIAARLENVPVEKPDQDDYSGFAR